MVFFKLMDDRSNCETVYPGRTALAVRPLKSMKMKEKNGILKRKKSQALRFRNAFLMIRQQECRPKFFVEGFLCVPVQCQEDPWQRLRNSYFSA